MDTYISLSVGSASAYGATTEFARGSRGWVMASLWVCRHWWNGLATPVLRKTDSKALYHRRPALAGSRVEESSQFVCMYIVGTVLISYAAVMIRYLSSPGADIADQPGSKV